MGYEEKTSCTSIEVLDMDIINESNSGAFNVSPDKEVEDFKIERGYPKDGKKNKKIFSHIGVVQQNRLPVLAQALSGNCSEAIEFINHLSEEENLFYNNWRTETQTIERYERGGRPTPQTKKIKKITHHAFIERDEDTPSPQRPSIPKEAPGTKDNRSKGRVYDRCD